MVRFLLYATEWEVEGIVVAGGRAPLEPVLAAYAEVRPQLARHQDGYPSASALAAVTVNGPVDGDEGVALILQRLRLADTRPLWFLRWGLPPAGSVSNLRRALDRLKAEDGDSGYRAALARLRLVGSGDALSEHLAQVGLSIDTTGMEAAAQALATPFDFDVERDVRTGHGPLGALYPAGVRETASLTFLHLYASGLTLPHEPRWSSWGGRYAPDASGSPALWVPAPAPGVMEGSAASAVASFASDIQRDFRARLDRCLPGARVNRPPQPRVVVSGEPGSAAPAVTGGPTGTEPLWVAMKPGMQVTLEGAGSTDPDGHSLSFRWSQDRWASSYAPALWFPDDQSFSAFSVRLPEDFPEGQTLHLIMTATDDGTPPLTRYRRVILTRPR